MPALSNLFLYSIHYNPAKNEFDGQVESEYGQVVFEINDIHQVRRLIANKTLGHIDDVIGLQIYLKSLDLIPKGAIVELIII